MVIYLRHPVHGCKVAISEDEAKADEKNGWSRFTPGVAEKPAAGEETGNAFARAALAREYQERFGKAPHHKKSVETLKAELAA